MARFFDRLLHRDQPQDSYRQLFSSFERSAMLMSTPQQLESNRAQLHDLFAANTWSSLDYDTKCQAVQALENDFAFQQGRPAKTVEVTGLDEGCYGGWSAKHDTIFLNENLLRSGSLYSGPDAQPLPDANMQTFDTIAHEGYHAYQSYALEHPEVHADKAQLSDWARNEGEYYDTGNRYLIQPQERDAWQYGHDATVQAFQGIEERNGPEPPEAKAEYENAALINSYEAALSRELLRDPQVLEHMQQEMEAGCQAKGIDYNYEPKNQILSTAPQPEHQGVQQGQAPPEEARSQGEDGPRKQETQSEQSAEDVPEEQENQAEDLSMDQAAGQAPEARQNQAEDLSMDQAAEQAPEERQNQAEDLSMDQAAAQVPEDQQNQAEDLSMDQVAEQAPDEQQNQAEDLSMEQAAEQAPGEQQNPTDDLSMDQMAEQTPGEGESESNAPAQEQDHSAEAENSSGESEDHSQGYAY